MTNIDYRTRLVDGLAQSLSVFSARATSFEELPDKWIAKSLLQKAIRRDDLTSALRATCFLLANDDKSFWRRLPIICWEDIGLVDIGLCASIDLVAGSKRLRAKLGSDWNVAAYLIEQMCAAEKDRSSDDLLTILEHGKASALIGRNEISLDEDAKILASVIEPAAKLLSNFDARKPADDEIEQLLSFVAGDQHNLIKPIFAGYKRTATLLPLMSALMLDEWRKALPDKPSISDDFGHDYGIATIPRYAFDGNTRAGRRYLQWLGNIDNDLANFLGTIKSKNTQHKLVRKLYFRIKSSLVAKRVDWQLGIQFREHADQIGFGLPLDQFEEGKGLLAVAMLRYPMSREHL